MANESIEQTTKESKRRLSLISWLKDRLRKPETEEIFDGFETELDKLRGMMGDIEDELGMIRNWNALLENAETGENLPSIIENGKRRGLMEAYNKKWIALEIGLTLYRMLLLESDRYGRGFAQEKPQLIARIRQYDPVLANRIESLRLPLSENEVLGILRPIMGIINKPQLLSSYISTHYDELMQNINKMKDQEEAKEVRHAVVVLSNREMEELSRCIADIRSWVYRGAYGISLFIERSYLYLRGGKSRYDGESFLGFGMHFRDERLVEELRASPEVKRIMTYVEELKFFKEARQTILRALEQPKWEGFLGKGGFLWNLYKGPKYIEMVRTRFGNHEFADLLSRLHGKIHENPEAWKNELGVLSEKLTRQYHQLVVEPAGNALIRMFDAAMKRLEKEKETAIAELMKLMTESDSLSKTRRQFLSLLEKRKRELVRELEKEKIVFESLIRDIILFMPMLDARLIRAIKAADGREIFDESRILDVAQSWRNFTLSQAPAYSDDIDALRNSEGTIRALSKSAFGMYNSLRAAIAEVHIKNNVGLKHIDSLIMLKRLLPFVENQIKPKLEKCRKHITSRLPQYITEVKVYLESQAIARQQATMAQFQERGMRGHQYEGNQQARVLPFNQRQRNPNIGNRQQRKAA